MVHRHDISPAQRLEAVRQMSAHAGQYGLVSLLSRELGVSRQTLYAWTEHGLQALQQTFLPAPAPLLLPSLLDRQVLTLLVEGHATTRGIQTCLRGTIGKHICLGTI